MKKFVIGTIVLSMICTSNVLADVKKNTAIKGSISIKPTKTMSSNMKVNNNMKKAVSFARNTDTIATADTKKTVVKPVKVPTKAEIAKIPVDFESMKKLTSVTAPYGVSDKSKEDLNTFLTNCKSILELQNTNEQAFTDLSYKIAMEYMNKIWNVDYRKGKEYYLNSIKDIINSSRNHFLNIELDNIVKNKVIMQSVFVTNKDMLFFNSGFGYRGKLRIKFTSANKGYFDYMFNGKIYELNKWYEANVDVVVMPDAADPYRHLKFNFIDFLNDNSPLTLVNIK